MIFRHAGIRFHYDQVGHGYPFICQHGLGADTRQPLSVLSAIPGFKIAAFDCRAHGETEPLGNPDDLSMTTFADDLSVFLDHLGHRQAIVGGISLGAAVALNFTVRYPQCVTAMILIRPAWLDRPAPPNLAIYDLVAKLIREYGAQTGLGLFKQTDDYQRVLRESSDAANALAGQFESERAQERVVRLERIPHDAPICDMHQLLSIKVPVLVLATRQDPIHPYDYAVALAQSIKSAVFYALTPKSVSKELYTEETRHYAADFLNTLESR